MNLDPNIVTGVCTVLGAAIGGLISYFAARRQETVDRLTHENSTLKREYLDACRNIVAFHMIEEAYYKALAPLVKKAENAVKLDIRLQVESAGGGRPTWSARDARKELEHQKI